MLKYFTLNLYTIIPMEIKCLTFVREQSPKPNYFKSN